ncbi:adhesion G protein-coupled receptor E3-like isoform X2 [Mustelus asterias]
MKTRHCLVFHAVFHWIIWNQNIHQSEALRISGKLRSSVSLPCTYNVTYYGLAAMCWGQGGCSEMSALFCSNVLFATVGKKITYDLKRRYNLSGDIERGDVSLTIHNLTMGDEGPYCCWVEYSGGNNKKEDIILSVKDEALQISGKLRSSVSLPCTYNVTYYGLAAMCWGQDGCCDMSAFSCSKVLLKTDGKNIIYRLNTKYSMSGDIERGNVSLTIHNVTMGDEGPYCCRVEYSGGNNKKEDIILSVKDDRPFKCLSDNGTLDSAAECQSNADSLICRFMNQSTILDKKVCNDAGAVVPVQTVLHFAEGLLSNVTDWKNASDTEKHKVASQFLENMESAVVAAALGLRKAGNTNWTTPTLDLQIGFIERGNITGSDMMTLQAKGNTLNVYSSTIIGDKDSALLAFMSYSNLESIIGTHLVAEDGRKFQKLPKFYSKVVTVTKGNRESHELNGTVNVTFQEVQGKAGGDTGEEKVCAFWDSSAEGGYWSTVGCKLVTWSDTHTECSCSHLSSFAVLMALYEIKNTGHQVILHWITIVGLPISLLCLLISIGTFLCCQSIQSLNTTIRTHMCLNLFLAEVLFLIAISIKVRTVFCAIVAGGLHFLLLAAFAWMCLESVQLCLMVLNLKVVNFSRVRVIRRRFIYPIGYGCPAVIVVISAAVNAEGYGTDSMCWLNLEKDFIWSFLGPVCFIILVNTILFSITLWILKGKISSLNADVSRIKESRILTFKAMAQFVMLGCSWIFGAFQIKADTIVMSYLFTIINVTQGVFIFCIYCLLNSQVRREYLSCFNKMCRSKKVETSDIYSSTMTTHSAMVLKTVDSLSPKSEVTWNLDTDESMNKEN